MMTTNGTHSAFQSAMLQRVSRTYALTIPQLPDGLREVITNAYLLCRIADTIEDEPDLSPSRMQEFLELFLEVVEGRAEAEPFARELRTRLSHATPAEEHDLVAETARVVRITHGFRAAQRRPLERCLRIMAHGMVEFRPLRANGGLKDMQHLKSYCYHVAGGVGEMLADLYCDHSPEIAARRDELNSLSVWYGEGLQMTNVLKDVWEDYRRGVCWLPRDVFGGAGVDLRKLSTERRKPGFAMGLDELVAATHGHLDMGLRFILAIPAQETGIRRHMLWTLGLAVLTLRRVHSCRRFRAAGEIRLSPLAVRAMLAGATAAAHSDVALRAFFNTLTRRLGAEPTGDGRPRTGNDGRALSGDVAVTSDPA